VGLRFSSLFCLFIRVDVRGLRAFFIGLVACVWVSGTPRILLVALSGSCP
jgi:hypothetical protein